MVEIWVITNKCVNGNNGAKDQGTRKKERKEVRKKREIKKAKKKWRRKGVEKGRKEGRKEKRKNTVNKETRKDQKEDEERGWKKVMKGTNSAVSVWWWWAKGTKIITPVIFLLRPGCSVLGCDISTLPPPPPRLWHSSAAWGLPMSAMLLISVWN